MNVPLSIVVITDPAEEERLHAQASRTYERQGRQQVSIGRDDAWYAAVAGAIPGFGFLLRFTQEPTEDDVDAALEQVGKPSD